MKGLRFKRYLNVISLSSVLALVICKSVLRPWVRQNDFAEIFTIILNSIPNFLEPLVGVPALTGLLFMARHDNANFLTRFSEEGIYLLSISLATVYVISQELKIHSIGGNNVYDPNDLIASGIDLVLMLGVMFRYGFIKKEASLVDDSQATKNSI